jgi:hypothetical protein
MNDRLKTINESTATPVNTRSGLSGHPDALANIAPTLVDGGGGAGESAYQAARVGLKSMYDALGEMDAATAANLAPVARGSRTAMEIPNDRRAALANAMGQRFESAAKTVDRSIGAIKESLAALEKAVDSALLNPRRNETGVATAAAQIRDYVRSLKDGGARMQFLKTSIDNADHETISAVLQTSNWISGLSREEAQLVRELAEQKFATRAANQRNAARKALDTVMQAGGRFVSEYHKMVPRIVPDKGTDAVRRLAGAAS